MLPGASRNIHILIRGQGATPRQADRLHSWYPPLQPGQQLSSGACSAAYPPRARAGFTRTYRVPLGTSAGPHGRWPLERSSDSISRGPGPGNLGVRARMRRERTGHTAGDERCQSLDYSPDQLTFRFGGVTEDYWKSQCTVRRVPGDVAISPVAGRWRRTLHGELVEYRLLGIRK
jgi:hypothetical protein